ncbi:uncharacterized protein LOC141811334 [Halichoeres trimaculatus]|uniref:uncharacterized protein LOC141811334 n=1 Tax=Halichoeres trimaculatus TaxID=147232 RepID=UPI003D9DB43C
MTALSFAVCLTCLFLRGLAQMTDLKSFIHVRQVSGFIEANVGDNVTLECFYYETATMFYWYRQSLGDKPKLMVSFYRHDESGVFVKEFKDISRFQLDAGSGKFHLKILNLDPSDSATYFCTGSYDYDFEFIDGVNVIVKGSGLNTQYLVHPSGSETIQSGGSTTLDCTVHTGTCDGEHRVYWFRHSQEPQPGLIYTHGGRNDQCERKSNQQTHTCIYNLPVKSQSSSSHAVCAVASCGQILFGQDKKLDKKNESDSFALVHFLIGALVFTTSLVILLVYALYKQKYCQSSPASTENTGENQDPDSIHYAALKVQRATSRSVRHREDVPNECVYSSVRQ